MCRATHRPSRLPESKGRVASHFYILPFLLAGCFMAGDFVVRDTANDAGSEVAVAPAGQDISPSGVLLPRDSSSPPLPSWPGSSASGSVPPISLSAGPLTATSGMPSGAPAPSASAPTDTLLAPGQSVFTGGRLPSCIHSLSKPYNGAWGTFQDDTGVVSRRSESPGRSGTEDCALHIAGSSLDDWGGGAALLLDDGYTVDGSRFGGLRLWLKGWSKGGYRADASSGDKVPADNWLRVQVKTGETSRDGDWGFFCSMKSDSWTLCESRFADLGWEYESQYYEFDPGELRGLGLVISTPDGQKVISYDFWVDDIHFF
jgi:hypothetical protein